jgi:hypothetical protein
VGQRKLPIDLEELIIAFDTNLMEANYYLDLETGDVILVSDEARSLAEEIVESIPEDEEVTREALEAAVEDRDEQDWMLEEAIRAALVEEGFGTRYVEVPTVESREGYRDMEDFIETVSDPQIRELGIAIAGRGAFRRFKDVLLDYPAERERWFAFEKDRMQQRVLDWLDEIGVEPLPRSNAPQEG